MDTKLVEVLDKHINQEALLKDLAVMYVMPILREKVAGIDIIPGTTIDNEAIKLVMDYLEGLVA